MVAVADPQAGIGGDVLTRHRPRALSQSRSASRFWRWNASSRNDHTICQGGRRIPVQEQSEIDPMEMIACHDCGNPVSLSARQCPTCGSKDLAGPYRPGRKHRVEYRNDRNLAATSLSLGLL